MYLRKTILLALLTLIGCGRGFEEKSDPQYEIAQSFLVSHLRTFNKHSKSSNAELKISIIENQIWVRIFYSGSSSNQSFIQLIHQGSKCPDRSWDLNRDGHIDFEEVLQGAGPIVLPLDSNITTRFRGLASFPRQNRKNKYYYSESANYRQMLQELSHPMEQDIFPFESIKDEREFSLNGKVLYIYGVHSQVDLPGTVYQSSYYSSQQLYPIMCGIIDGP